MFKNADDTQSTYPARLISGNRWKIIVLDALHRPPSSLKLRLLPRELLQPLFLQVLELAALGGAMDDNMMLFVQDHLLCFSPLAASCKNLASSGRHINQLAHTKLAARLGRRSFASIHSSRIHQHVIAVCGSTASISSLQPVPFQSACMLACRRDTLPARFPTSHS